MVGAGGGSTGVDENFARRSMNGFGALILGQNMFGPGLGAWPNDNWKGWWGDNHPVTLRISCDCPNVFDDKSTT